MTAILQELANLLIDVSIKAVLLAAAAGAGLLIFRVRSSTVQHRVWATVVAGMVLLPLLVWMTPGVRLPAWLYPEFHGRDNAAGASRMASAPLATSSSSEELVTADPARLPADPDVQPTRNRTGGASPAAIAAGDIAANSLDQPNIGSLSAPQSASVWIVAALIVYVAGVGARIGRLLVAILQTRKLVSTARPISLPSAIARLVGATAVCESPIVRVPLTVGWRRPSILLPSDWASWNDSLIATVLTHEQAHVRRHDQWIALVSEWNRAVYWFHPLAWFLRGRLTALAEQACDDAVIEALGDRTAYARHLLDMARRLTGDPRRLRLPAVAMAATPKVERRIDAILDSDRPLARRLSKAGAFAILIIMTPLLLWAAGLQADDAHSQPTKPESPVAKQASSNAERFQVGPNDIGGTCLDSDRAPVAQVKVMLYVIRIRHSSQTLLQEASTGSTGRFTFTKTPALPGSNQGGDHYLIIARRDGYATAVQRARPGEASDLAMPKPATFKGTVKDSDGKPVSSAIVYIGHTIPFSDYPLFPIEGVYSSKTNGKGEFTINDLAEFQFMDREFVSRTAHSEVRGRLGPPWLTVQHPDFVRTTVPFTKIPGAANVVLAKGAVLMGQVVHGNTGKPAIGITVELQGLDPQSGQARSFWSTAKSDNEGRYRLGPLPEGKFNIFIESGLDVTAEAIDSIEVRGDRSVNAPPIRLVKGGVVKGRVIDDSTGKLVSLGDDEYLDVQVHGPSRPWSGAAVDVVEIRKDGTFEIRLPPGTNWLALRTDNGEEAFEVASGGGGGNVTVPDGSEIKVEYHVKRVARASKKTGTVRSSSQVVMAGTETSVPSTPEEGIVSGVLVKASDGSPVEGAHVILRSGRTNDTKSDATGRFRFEKIPSSQYGYEIWAYQGNLVAQKTPVPQLQVANSDAAAFAPLRLEMADGRQAEFTVTSKSNGQPIAGAAVRFGYPDRRKVETDNDGKAIFMGLLRQEYDVTIEADGHAREKLQIDLSNADSVSTYKVSLVQGGILRGLVVDELGKAVPGAEVLYRESNQSTAYYGDSERTDSEGHFRHRFLPLNKPIEVTVRGNKHIEQTKEVLLTAGQREMELRVRLARQPKGGSVAGTVSDPSGRPVAGAKIANYGNRSDPHATTMTDAEGQFRLDDLIESSPGYGYEIAVSAKGFAPQRVAVHPGTAEHPGSVTTKLEPGHVIHGRVVNEQEKPMQRAYVSVRSGEYPMGLGNMARTDDDGKFALDSLPADARFDVFMPSYARLFNRLWKLDGADPVTVTLESPATIRGAVFDAENDKPLRGFRVRLAYCRSTQPSDPKGTYDGEWSEPGVMFNTADGRFAVEPLTNGMPVELTIEAEGYGRTVIARVVAAKPDKANELKITMKRVDRSHPSKLTGKLVNFEGKGVSGAQMRLIVSSNQPRGANDNQFNWGLIKSGQLARESYCDQFLSQVSDAEGRFEFANIDPGKYLQMAYWGDGIPQGRSLAFDKTRPGKTDTVTIKLPQPATVRGTIRRSSFPEAGSIALMRDWSEDAWLNYDVKLKDDQSTFEFRDLAPGSYSLVVQAKPARVSENGVTLFRLSPLAGKKLDVSAGETKEVHFTEPDKTK